MVHTEVGDNFLWILVVRVVTWYQELFMISIRQNQANAINQINQYSRIDNASTLFIKWGPLLNDPLCSCIHWAHICYTINFSMFVVWVVPNK